MNKELYLEEKNEWKNTWTNKKIYIPPPMTTQKWLSNTIQKLLLTSTYTTTPIFPNFRKRWTKLTICSWDFLNVWHLFFEWTWGAREYQQKQTRWKWCYPNYLQLFINKTGCYTGQMIEKFIWFDGLFEKFCIIWILINQ